MSRRALRHSDGGVAGAERLFASRRIRTAAVGIVSTRADESFFRGGEPERSPGHTVVAWPNARPPAASIATENSKTP